MPAAVRSVAILNRHPRLCVPPHDLRRLIALLDAHFRVVPSDLETFAPARARDHRAVIRKSKIPPACPPGELSLVFLTDEALARIHADFMSDPTPTDVITFDGDATAGLAGEICVSADMAARHVGLPVGPAGPKRARRGSRSFQTAFAAELTLYIVHGWLHLAGYDDLRPDHRLRMRAAERRALCLLAAHGAVPAFALN